MRKLAILALGIAVLAAPVDARPRQPIDPAAKMPPLAPAVIDDTLAIGGEELAARKLESRLTVEVGVNGSGPYRFVVDSGADTSVIGTRLAAALHLPAGHPVMLNGITESRRVDRVLVDTLQLGPTQFHDLELPRLDEHDLGAVGMIGLDALINQRLMLDFEARRISVDDASLPAPRMDGEIVVVARLKRGQLILTQVRANGVPLDAVIDTGSEITIGNTALRNQLFHRRHREVQKIEVVGVTGAKLSLDLLVVDELKIGGVVLSNVPIAFADVPPFAVFSLDQHPALLLGTDLMESFRKVSLDFHARKVRFQLRKCTSEGIIVSTTLEMSRLRPESEKSAVCKR
ncbi:MAG: retroviral-like aspartic protease family protein [Pseudomonadota bacterium]|nr:retroviral-like aspartic protease family protein [Pseudomonadota bacterium]